MKNKKLILYIFLGLMILSFVLSHLDFSDKPKSEEPKPKHEALQTQMQAIPFDADTAYSYIEYQVNLGYRLPESKEHKACGDWIIKLLRSWGYTISEQTFEGTDYFGKPVTGRNIIASLNPNEPQRVILLAHYDTRPVADQEPNPLKQKSPIYGADDGASGVAVLLELARQSHKRASKLPLDFFFVDLEDGGKGGTDDGWCLGSKYWSKHPHLPNYQAKYGVLLDMVGARDARFCWEAYSKAYAGRYVYTFWEVAAQLGWGKYFINKDTSGLVDDHVPLIKDRKIPTLDIVNYDSDRDTGFGKHWHTQEDNLNIISRETLRAVGETVGTTLELIHKQK